MKKTIITVSIIVGVVIFGVIFTTNVVSFSNQEITLRNSYKQKTDERTAFYDKMWKIFSQKSQIAVQNDSSFRKNIDIIMSARGEQGGALMTWITETNPNVNYEQVSVLYQDLSRAIEAQREGFFVEEKYIQDIVQQHSNLLEKFPGSLYNWILSRKKLEYKVITSTITDQVMKEGKDDNVKLF